MMKKDKLIVKSDVEFRVEEEVKDAIALEVKKIVDNMSAKYMRNIKAEIKIDVE